MSQQKKCKDNLRQDQINIIQKIGTSADKAQEKCYLVGGLVRDCLLGTPSDDLDFVCSNPNKIVTQLIQDNPNNVKEIEKNENTRFKSKIILINGEKVDIVEPRKESYTKSSIKPQVESGSFIDDVNRRDFTINTLYLDTSPQSFLNIVDLTQKGLLDLQNKVLDTPTNPEITFTDDPTRMLRGIRFSACKKMHLHDRLKTTIKQGMKKEIHRVPTDLIVKEFKKGASCPAYFNIMQDVELLEELIPEITQLKNVPQLPTHHKLDVFGHTMESLKHLDTTDYRINIAMLLHDIGKPETTECKEGKCTAYHHQDKSAEKTEIILKRLKFSNDDIKHITNLVKNHHLFHNTIDDVKITDKALRRIIREHGSELQDIETMTRADILSDNPNAKQEIVKLDSFLTRLKQIQTESPQLETFKLAITGHDIMAMGYKDKEIGDMKIKIEQMVIDGELPNDRLILLQKIPKK